MAKTNEEKAKELADYYAGETDYKETAAYDAALAMAQWKDEEIKAEKQALINKACEWLSNNIEYYTDTQNDSEGNLCEVILENALIRDFRKLLKGGDNE